jgi:hypothetical protein
MAYILDAYNVVYAGDAMGGAMSGLTVRKLCQWIVASPQRLAATLVLDGRAKPEEPSENEFPEITLVYSGTGIKADTVIAQMVERSGNRKKLTVVTNDRAVALHARRHNATAMSCEAFLTHLIAGPRGSKSALPPRKTGTAGTTGETAHWLKEFGITPPPVAPPPATDDPFDAIDMDKLMGD